MSVDLDELFDALRHQADTIPLAGVADAHDRGLRHRRRQAVLAVAAALALVTVGTALLVRSPNRHPAPPSHRPLSVGSPVPLVSPPIDLGGTVTFATGANDSQRAYTAYTLADHTSWVTATELRTGRTVWSPRGLSTGDLWLSEIVSVPAAVLVVAGGQTGSSGHYLLDAYDPATGNVLWEKNIAVESSFVYTDDALIQFESTSATAGTVHGFDWRTGGSRWSLNLLDDPVRRVLGMGTEADAERLGYQPSEPVFADRRFVTLTTSGQAQLRDVTTGQLLRSVPTDAIDARGAVVSDGWLYARSATDGDDGPQHIRAVDLLGNAGSTVAGALQHGFVTMAGCGTERVCVLTQDRNAFPPVSALTALDARKHRRLWSAASHVSGDTLSSAHGAILVQASDVNAFELFDAGGKLRFTGTLAGGWLDSRTLLVAAPDGTARESRWSVADHQLTPLGDPFQEQVGGCTSTADRLVCATETQLKVWRMR